MQDSIIDAKASAAGKRGCDCAPILLIGFNRPDFMVNQIASIRPSQPSRLYVAVDGPRADRAGEPENCLRVRECIKLVDWPCEVKTLFRENNLGCKYNVSGAISWFFENEEYGIVLEDDIRISGEFLRFASEMLERYKNDTRVGAVNGFNFFNLQSDNSVSYHFSSHMDVWGWASWRRVWEQYDVEVAGREEEYLEAIDNSAATPYMRNIYRKFLSDVKGGLSTWDVQLSLLFISRHLLSIVPRERLVTNAGIADERATHTGGYVYWNSEWAEIGTIDFPLVHPVEVVCDKKADYVRERMEGAILPRGLTWLGAKCPHLSGILTCIGRMIATVAPFLFGKWREQ